MVIKVLKCIVVLIFIFIMFPPFLWPISGPVTSKFLFRLKPDSNTLKIEVHHGIDIGSSINTPIFTSSLGKVKTIGFSKELGNYITINHLFWFSTIYAPLNDVNVKEKQIVYPGISRKGSVGMTGRTTGPHLHYGIYIFNTALSPEVLLLFHTIRKLIIKF